MVMNSNFNIFAKLVAISIVGGVAKSLFGQTPNSTPVVSHFLDKSVEVVDAVKG